MTQDGDTDHAVADKDPAPPDRVTQNMAWWLRVLEVRLRFVMLVVLVLAVMTQWQRLRNAWDDWLFAWGKTRVASVVSGSIEYFCPMDPGVVSIWPAICPICSMDLVQRKKHDAQLLPEGVIARMQFTPYRVQLGGIQTMEVSTRELVYDIQVAGILNCAEALQKTGDLPASGVRWQFEAAISRNDAPLLKQPRPVSVFRQNSLLPLDAVAEIVDPDQDKDLPSGATQDLPRVRVQVVSEDAIVPGTRVRAVIHVPAGVLTEAPRIGPDQELADVQTPLAIPESAVIDQGHRQLVFVESMPGTFDATLVALGPRCGDFYPVLNGLEPRQRIAVAGAFLIDAETRLNPSLAVGYFGASQALTEQRLPTVRMAAKRIATTSPQLSPEDAALVEKQKVCPVTDLPLDSMGGPVKVVVNGRTVFLCCMGCEPRLTKDPEKYLARLRTQ